MSNKFGNSLFSLLLIFSPGLARGTGRSGALAPQPHKVMVGLGVAGLAASPAAAGAVALVPALPQAVMPAPSVMAAPALAQPETVRLQTIDETVQRTRELIVPIAEMAAGGGSAEALSAAGRDLADLRAGDSSVAAESSADSRPLSERIAAEQPYVKKYYEQIRRVIVGQQVAVDLSLVSLLVQGGHFLLEGMPGLGKTKLIETISAVSGLTNMRIQFRPDMLPADIVGFKDKDPDGKWTMKWGPITKAHIVQADEINRGTPRAKAALLQPMQEGRVTVDDETKELPQPSRVHATMNPIDTEGVFPMLEPEKDRFLISAFIDYPTKEEEKRIAREQSKKDKVVPEQVLSEAHINRLQALVEQIEVGDAIEDYIQDIVRATRPPATEDSEPNPHIDLKGNVMLGASPRASIAMTQVARVYAFLAGRAYVNAKDVQDAALPALRHRIKRSSKGLVNRVTPESIIAEILLRVPIPS